MRSRTSPILYNPEKPGYATRIKPEDWQKFREKITALHNEGCTKEQIRAYLKNDREAIQLCFKPSMGQLVLKMSAWQLSAHRRNPVFASRARAIPEGGTTDQHVKRSSEPDSGSENNYDDNAQLASFISSNPPLVLTQTSSMVDCSSNDITHKPEIPTSPPGSIQPLSDDHFWYRYKQCPEAETTYLLPNSQFLKDEPATCSELPALLVETLEMLAASHSQEVHDSTAFLAAAAMYENAFDIFQLTSDGIKIAPRWKLLANIYSRKDTTGSKATSTHSYEEDSF